MIEKCKSSSHSERIVVMWRDIRLFRVDVRTVRDNADRITEISKSESEVFVPQDYHSTVGTNRAKKKKNYGHESLTFLLY